MSEGAGRGKEAWRGAGERAEPRWATRLPHELDFEDDGTCDEVCRFRQVLELDRRTRARIFNPCFPTRALGRGTGLGLSTVCDRGKGARGSIEVDRATGRGTVLMIYLPRTAGLGPSAGAGQRRGFETVLLVEDEDDIRDLVREFLEMQGYHVLEASDGVDALRASSEYEGRIHVVVTDVRMPRMDGYELGKRLLVSRPEVKVIYTSGYPAPAADEPDLPHSAPFLQKPYSLERLVQTIRAEVDEPKPG